MMEMLLRDDAATQRLGRDIGGVLTGGDVVALRGTLGAGKTTLVRGIAAALGIDDLASPSFGLVHEHLRPAGGRFMHVDAWRLHAPQDMLELGWDEWAAATDTMVCVEWADRLGEPAAGLWQSLHVLDIELAHAAGGRVVTLHWAGDSRLASLAASGETP
ncbi:MAG: tRNA (adenosine(37)-N6)-threonylcarbamoyltransferase complex ATPase subunit type 1 TsaE [Phycisphaerales bacterium]|jgi:tRNA threonylcarbamoyladenosine biosynthesis protein TsaE|nr:tRNA (adenosine(37)-N6)-threonylcarbamoyltransferase complex ATPase subunit type 1 TsaE [Phycisphaerales bacterium]